MSLANDKASVLHAASQREAPATLPGLQEMIDAFKKSRNDKLAPAEFWTEINRKNVGQLETCGYENFKRTIALNYFTWLLGPWSKQARFLMRNVPLTYLLASVVRTLTTGRHQYLSWPQSLSHNFLTYLVYEYATRALGSEVLDALAEPREGNPPGVYLKNRLISQDLPNSLLEFASITRVTGTRELKSVIELGAGYGRVGFVFLKLVPGLKYTIVDMPPALYVSQRYLCSQFAGKKIFRFRHFDNYAEVATEYEASDLVFLMPAQLALLPSKSVDLFVNISSFHEMHLEQIDYYFGEVERLSRRFFYTKQYKVYPIPVDNHITREEEFPVRPHWKELFHRDSPVQADFFEALYDVSTGKAAK